jgi:hypothetical protein
VVTGTTTPQLTVGYDATRKFTLGVDSGGVVRISSTSNYIDFDVPLLVNDPTVATDLAGNASLKVNGGATVTKTVLFGTNVTMDPSAYLWKELPVQVVWGMSGSPLVSLYGSMFYYSFSGAADNTLCGMWKVPFEWMFQTQIRVILAWCGATTAAGNVSWTLTYNVTRPGGTVNTVGTSVTKVVANATGQAYEVQRTDLATIDMTGVVADGSACMFKLVRNGSTDTYNDAAMFVGWTCNFRLGRWGTATPQ